MPDVAAFSSTMSDPPITPLGVHAMVFMPSWTHPEAEQAAAKAVATGFSILEIPLSEQAAAEAELTRELLDRHSLRAVCSLGLDASTDIASDEPQTVERGEQRLLRAVEATHVIGAKLLTGVTYGAMGHHNARVSSKGRASAQAVLTRIAGAAEVRGVRIGVEVVNRYESNVLNTTEEGLAFIDGMGAPNVVLHLDTYHMNIEESDFRTPVLLAGDRLGYVHVGESHRGYLGTGTVDFATFFQALAEVSYKGPLTFEGFSATRIDNRLAGALSIWRETWHDGQALAAHAQGFLADQMMAWSRPPATTP